MTGFKMAEGYRSALTLRETQQAIKFVKDVFQKELADALHLERISAPLFVTKDSGINDDLNGVERKVEFDIRACGVQAQVVQSLAKWKRMALARYGMKVGEGLYTDMCAIRRDDEMDNDHSIYVDQWDWERVISADDRSLAFLEEIARKIVGALVNTKKRVTERYSALHRTVCGTLTVVSAQELEDRFPQLTPKQREMEFVREYKTVLITGIGGALRSGEKHDGRAPDYDDWALNGDLLVWNEVLEQPLELSSMGVRVDADSLRAQLKICGAEDRMRFPYHKGIADGSLPLTVGGGIGQSRLCMYLLEKLHIGEVQASVWSPDVLREAERNGVQLL